MDMPPEWRNSTSSKYCFLKKCTIFKGPTCELRVPYEFAEMPLGLQIISFGSNDGFGVQGTERREYIGLCIASLLPVNVVLFF